MYFWKKNLVCWILIYLILHSSGGKKEEVVCFGDSYRTIHNSVWEKIPRVCVYTMHIHLFKIDMFTFVLTHQWHVEEAGQLQNLYKSTGVISR